MGSGSRFKFYFNPTFWVVGASYQKFPFDHTIGLFVGPFEISVGLGEAYDDCDQEFCG